MKTAIQHLKISSAGFHNFAFFLLTFYFLKLINQFESIMQNKPNLLAPQMNLNSYLTKDYENIANWKLGQNKANTNPIRTQYEPKQTQFPKSQKWTKTYLPQRFMRI